MRSVRPHVVNGNDPDEEHSHLLSRHELGLLLDEEMTEDERIELQLAEDVCRRRPGLTAHGELDIATLDASAGTRMI